MDIEYWHTPPGIPLAATNADPPCDSRRLRKKRQREEEVMAEGSSNPAQAGEESAGRNPKKSKPQQGKSKERRKSIPNPPDSSAIQPSKHADKAPAQRDPGPSNRVAQENEGDAAKGNTPQGSPEQPGAEAHSQADAAPADPDAEKRARKKERKKAKQKLKEVEKVDKGKGKAKDTDDPKGKKSVQSEKDQSASKPAKEAGRTKGKGKDHKPAKDRKPPVREDLSEWSASEPESDNDVFTVTKTKGGFIRPEWLKGKDLSPQPRSFYSCHEAPFLEAWQKGELEEKVRLLVKGTFPVLATIWGNMTAEGRNRILAAARFITESDQVELRPLKEDKLTNWVVIACPTKEMQTRLVDAESLVHVATDTPIIFRQFRSKIHKRRTITLINVPNDTVEKQVVDSLLQTSGATKARVIATMGKDNDARVVALNSPVVDKVVQPLLLPKAIVVEVEGKESVAVTVRKAPYCKGCHSEDHTIQICPWMDIDSIRPPRITSRQKRLASVP
jgi:hypothetical protein